MTGRAMGVIAGAALAVGSTVALGGLSQVPYRPEVVSHAVIRLAWRARGVTVKECRTLTPEEQEKVAVHMRRTQVCEGRTLPYRLRAEVDGEARIDETVHAGGARGDRPLFVLHDLAVAPGRHRVAVSFTRDTVPEEGVSEQEITPAVLEFDRHIDVGAGQILLVTYDPDRRTLVAYDAPDGR